MQLLVVIFVSINLFAGSHSCSFLRSTGKSKTIGPPCTQGGHNPLPPSGVCPQSSDTFAFPDMHDAPSGQATIHRWPPWYTIEWMFYYVFDRADVVPLYFPVPTANFTVSSGRTYYDSTTSRGRCMRQFFDQRCISIFTTGVLSINNNYSCEFLNIADTQTAYLILHDDRPKGAPKCCIVGQPFYPPSRNFTDNLYIKKVSIIEGIDIDWYGATMQDAGLYLYGFYNKTTSIPHDLIPASRPYAAYMMGAPHIAVWMYLKYGDWDPITKPDPTLWDIPEVCQQAAACPGSLMSHAGSFSLNTFLLASFSEFILFFLSL